MKFYKNHLIWLILGIFILNACQSEITEIAIPYENRLVVSSFISPQDTILNVRVTSTQPISGTSEKNKNLVENATVTMSNGTKTVALKYDKDGYYKVLAKELPINPGTNCTLKISTPEGRSTEGNCTIPKEVLKPSDVTTEIIKISEARRQYYIRWKDFPNQENYYNMFGSYETVDTRCTNGLNFVTNDKGRDGEQLFLTANTDIVCGKGNPNYIVILSSYDKNAVQFFATASEQSSVAGVPFTDPVLVYSNMKGAYGVFSGYNQTKVILKIF
jgi:Domain of unknown function (DUF4249)